MLNRIKIFLDPTAQLERTQELIKAVEEKQYSKIKKCIADGAYVNVVATTSGETALTTACRMNDLEAVKLIFECDPLAATKMRLCYFPDRFESRYANYHARVMNLIVASPTQAVFLYGIDHFKQTGDTALLTYLSDKVSDWPLLLHTLLAIAVDDKDFDFAFKLLDHFGLMDQSFLNIFPAGSYSAHDLKWTNYAGYFYSDIYQHFAKSSSLGTGGHLYQLLLASIRMRNQKAFKQLISHHGIFSGYFYLLDNAKTFFGLTNISGFYLLPYTLSKFIDEKKLFSSLVCEAVRSGTAEMVRSCIAIWCECGKPRYDNKYKRFVPPLDVDAIFMAYENREIEDEGVLEVLLAHFADKDLIKYPLVESHIINELETFFLDEKFKEFENLLKKHTEHHYYWDLKFKRFSAEEKGIIFITRGNFVKRLDLSELYRLVKRDAETMPLDNEALFAMLVRTISDKLDKQSASIIMDAAHAIRLTRQNNQSATQHYYNVFHAIEDDSNQTLDTMKIDAALVIAKAILAGEFEYARPGMREKIATRVIVDNPANHATIHTVNQQTYAARCALAYYCIANFIEHAYRQEEIDELFNRIYQQQRIVV